MEDDIIIAILETTEKLTKLSLAERPDADSKSIDVLASVALLIVSTYLINEKSQGNTTSVIDKVRDGLLGFIPEADVNLRTTILNQLQCDVIAREHINGAYKTNVLGAITAIYNSRVSDELSYIRQNLKHSFQAEILLAKMISRYLFVSTEERERYRSILIFIVGTFIKDIGRFVDGINELPLAIPDCPDSNQKKEPSGQRASSVGRASKDKYATEKTKLNAKDNVRQDNSSHNPSATRVEKTDPPKKTNTGSAKQVPNRAATLGKDMKELIVWVSPPLIGFAVYMIVALVIGALGVAIFGAPSDFPYE